jgi:hypothetical protein
LAFHIDPTPSPRPSSAGTLSPACATPVDRLESELKRQSKRIVYLAYQVKFALADEDISSDRRQRLHENNQELKTLLGIFQTLATQEQLDQLRDVFPKFQ